MRDRLRELLPTSLTARLVVIAVGLVALVCVLIALTTTLAMRASLLSRLDEDVTALARRPTAVPPGGGGPDFRNRGPGTLVAVVGDQQAQRWGTVAGEQQGGDDEVGARDLDRLDDVPADGHVHGVDLPGAGSYRVVARTGVDPRTGDPVTLVSGLPTTEVDDTIANLVAWEALLTLVGVGAAAAAGAAVVRRQLRPLREVADTAHAVAALPLAAGEIEVSERVPGVLTDERTEVGQVGAALNTLLDHVEESLAARHRSEQQVRQFVADASHELRTPLTTIRGYTELARRHPDDTTAGATALAKVEEESVRMTAMVEDLLLLARLDQGRPLEREPVDLTRLLIEAVSDARVLDRDRKWQLVLPADADPERPVVVTGDGQRLHQVITNLLGNARVHTPPGTTVTVTVRADGFDVHDDGPGFPAELVPHAFERFTRGDSARVRAGGAGLGLSLVRAIVASHGGTVALDSRPGDTVLRVRLGAQR